MKIRWSMQSKSQLIEAMANTHQWYRLSSFHHGLPPAESPMTGAITSAISRPLIFRGPCSPLDLFERHHPMLHGAAVARLDQCDRVQVLPSARLGLLAPLERRQELRHRAGEGIGEPR